MCERHVCVNDWTLYLNPAWSEEQLGVDTDKFSHTFKIQNTHHMPQSAQTKYFIANPAAMLNIKILDAYLFSVGISQMCSIPITQLILIQSAQLAQATLNFRTSITHHLTLATCTPYNQQVNTCCIHQYYPQTYHTANHPAALKLINFDAYLTRWLIFCLLWCLHANHLSSIKLVRFRYWSGRNKYSNISV